MTVERIIKTADHALDIGNGREFLDLLRSDDMGIEAHIAMLGAFGLEVIHAVRGSGKSDAANMMQPAGLARQLLQLLIELDGVALKGGDVGIGVDGMKSARGVPGGTGGQLGPFNQCDICPAQLGQMIQNGTSDDTPADHGDLDMGFHNPSPFFSSFSFIQAR